MGCHHLEPFRSCHYVLLLLRYCRWSQDLGEYPRVTLTDWRLTEYCDIFSGRNTLPPCKLRNSSLICLLRTLPVSEYALENFLRC